MNAENDCDVIIVGAGFAGMYMLHRFLRMGLQAQVFEKGSGVGGTWYWNRYPGARCDIASAEYSFQFDDALQQEWDWSEKYSPQPEILKYANHVADRYNLRAHIQFNATVNQAEFDDEESQWTVQTLDATGEASAHHSTYLIAATGCLSSPNKPSLKGLETFAGSVYHTGEWPHDTVDFTGKRVAVVGTGSSAIQAIPVIATQAEHLTVFQRTANYAVPARNAKVTDEERSQVKKNYDQLRKDAATTRNGHLTQPNPKSALSVNAQERFDQYEARWKVGGLAFIGSFSDLVFNKESNKTAAEFVRQKIRDVVNDPITAEQLSPKSMIGCKRLCVDSGYYETYNRNNVSLVDLNETPIKSVTEKGIVADGELVNLDAIVFATGYDAMTGSLLKLNVKGREGISLEERWRAGPKTFLGIAMHDFPNFFTVTGPGSPSVLTNMLPSIEQHVNLIASIVEFAEQNKTRKIEADLDAQLAWVEHVNAVASTTIYPGCNSWYLGANVPGKPRVFMPYIGFPEYVARCEAMVDSGFVGFNFS